MGRSGGGRTGQKGGRRGHFIPERGGGDHPLFGMDAAVGRSARRKRRAAEAEERRAARNRKEC